MSQSPKLLCTKYHRGIGINIAVWRNRPKYRTFGGVYKQAAQDFHFLQNLPMPHAFAAKWSLHKQSGPHGRYFNYTITYPLH